MENNCENTAGPKLSDKESLQPDNSPSTTNP